MANKLSNPTPDKWVTLKNIDALILHVTTDPDSIMNDSPTKYESKQEYNQVQWRSKKDRSQEASFVMVGEISPDVRLGLYGDRLDKYINLSFLFYFIFILKNKLLNFYRRMILNKKHQKSSN